MKKFYLTEDNVKQYVEKIGVFIKDTLKDARKDGLIIGISGGVDCAVVAGICHKCGIKIVPVSLPNSVVCSSVQAMEKYLGIPINEYDIAPIVENYKKTLQVNEHDDLINLYPRIRMSIFYLLAARHNCLVAGTTNLSEITVGYYTKWGDGGNDLLPLGNLVKSEVYVLAKYLGIPDEIINAAPSAGLFVGQTDEKELGMTYSQIDTFILKGTSSDAEIDEQIKKRFAANYHKIEKKVFND